MSSQNAPGVTVVALVPSAGPVPPPMSVVMPAASATGICCGAIRCTWLSMPPAVRISPLPASTSVDGPMTSSGVTPSMVSGLPALPSATIRPSRTPTSALITPQWSSTTAPVMTRSGVPSARVATDCPMDSRMTLPPPKMASSPASGPGPPQRSSVTSISRSCRRAGPGPRSSARTGPHTGPGIPQSSSAPADSGRRPGTTRRPASATSDTSRETPGSNRTEVPAGMSSR